jgi:tetratricopeptide (TPR) repeat protein
MKTPIAVALLALVAGAAAADPSQPSVEKRQLSPAEVSAESEYNRGVRARVAKDWYMAIDAFETALRFTPDSADAWNELGYARRHVGKYLESLAAYDRALQINPDFPEALEYLGEAYVQMRRLDDARRVLDRLRPLDRARADELAKEIAKATKSPRSATP